MEITNGTGGSTRRAMLGLAGAVAGAMVVRQAAARPAGKASRAPTGVSGPLRSAGALSFGPDGVLFVGDIAGAAVHAFALRPADVTSQTDVELGNFHNFEGRDLLQGLDATLAAMLGTTPDQVVVNDMAVHQPSQQVFLSVERGRSTDALPAIVKLNHRKLELLDLAAIPHSQVAIPNEPDQSARLEFDTQRSFAITDVKYYGGEVFVSGIPTSASRPRCIASPILSRRSWRPARSRSGIRSTASSRRERPSSATSSGRSGASPTSSRCTAARRSCGSASRR